MINENANDAYRLGAELELVAHYGLHTLLAHMGSAVHPLRNSEENGVHTLWLELAPSESSLDDAVYRYASIVDGLSPDLRAIWDGCTDRCVNVGLQAGFRPHALPIVASRESIAELARLSLRLQVTLYAADPSAQGTHRTGRGTAA